MSNHPRHRTSPKNVQKERPLGELKFTVRVAPPDGPTDAEGQPFPADIEVDLRRFTLAERQLVRKVMAKFAEPAEMTDVVVAHAWVVWRRTNPSSSLQFWMDHITFGDLLDGLSLEPGHTEWDTTPEGYDPNP